VSADNATHHHGKSETDGKGAADEGFRAILREALDLRDDIATGRICGRAWRRQLRIDGGHRRLADGVELPGGLLVVWRLG
jgi:hypothetical protein